jgi:hypothetical protein
MIRKLTEVEKKLLLTMPLIDAAYEEIVESAVDEDVEELDDGGMGSLAFDPNSNSHNMRLMSKIKPIKVNGKKYAVEVYADQRKFGKIISEIETNDSDGIPVLISLYVDNLNNIYELDIWKTNFDKLHNLSVCLNNYIQHNTFGHEGFIREEKAINNGRALYVGYDNGGKEIAVGRVTPVYEREPDDTP